MNGSHRRFRLLIPLLLVSLLAPAARASAQEVIRITSYTARFGRNAEISKVTDEEITGVYAGMKGLKLVKFYFDPRSDERGSVTVWADRAALDAYMKSEVRKGILVKLKPLIEGEVTSRVFVVYNRGK